ncbi:hypothetical protein Q8F55_001909 [Vanrija albida]|uniref:Signal sequence receptor subunit alpha n=1 Tax=Vanrija albida TaxID=181172 RepID=A0ABR3Q8B7_9TREE
MLLRVLLLCALALQHACAFDLALGLRPSRAPAPASEHNAPGYAITSPRPGQNAVLKAEHAVPEFTDTVTHLGSLPVVLRLPESAPPTLVLKLGRPGEPARAFLYAAREPSFNPNEAQLERGTWPGSYRVAFSSFALGKEVFPKGTYQLTLHGGSFHGAVLATSAPFDIVYADPRRLTGWRYALFVATMAATLALLGSYPWPMMLLRLAARAGRAVLAGLKAALQPLARPAAAVGRCVAVPFARVPRLPCCAARKDHPKCEHCGCKA